MLGPAIDIHRRDTAERGKRAHGLCRRHIRFNEDLSDEFFRKSEQVIINADDHLCRVFIPRTDTTIHYVQFRRPVTPERRFFFVELQNISKDRWARTTYHIPIYRSSIPQVNLVR